MTFSMADSIYPRNIAAGEYDAGLGYVDGEWATAPVIRKMFAGKHVVTLTVTGVTSGADGIDCEEGNPNAAEAIAWVAGKAAVEPGSRPVAYADLATRGYSMGEIVAGLSALGVPRSQYRVLTAHYTGRPHICSPQDCGTSFTADGTQWTNQAPGLNGSVIDASLLADSFFGTTPQTVEYDMAKLAVLKQGDSDQPGEFWAVHRLQVLLAEAGKLNGITAAAGLSDDGSFGPKTTAALKAVQGHYGITRDGIAGAQSWGVLLTGSPS